MFTGLIMETGSLAAVSLQGQGRQLTVKCRSALDGVAIGDSIAVNGICLTVTSFDSGQFSAWASSETVDVTTLGNWKQGLTVNLESALTASTKMGGHQVQGHVDGVARVESITALGDSRDIVLSVEPDLMKYLVGKGSVALDGISLTVNKTFNRENRFSVRIIPETWQNTNIAGWQSGSAVNIETDVMGRYIVSYLENWLHNSGSLTLGDLKKKGF